MAIEYQRRMELADNLLKATAPSKQPDDNFRPSGWCDRMYYLLQQARLEQHAPHILWHQSPKLLSLTIARTMSDCDDKSFADLEQTVAKALKERQL